MSIPVIAILGRPNVGKSTLFNILTKSKDALVYDMPGVTRDLIYGEGSYENKNFIVIDTGGLVAKPDYRSAKLNSEFEQEIHSNITQKALSVAETEADILLFVVDAKAGLTPVDQEIADKLRETGKELILVVNKIDGFDEDIALADFYKLGINNIIAISATNRRGTTKLIEQVLAKYNYNNNPSEADKNFIKFAIIGRPNVGKSTLVNKILGEQRTIVYDQPGTTRDSIYINFTKDTTDYTIIDTAGVRRRGKIVQVLEKFSIVKSLLAIKQSQVVILMIDASENITDQDLHLLGYILNTGRSIIIACNKWDGLDVEKKNKIKAELQRRLVFAPYIKIIFISALHGTGVGNILSLVKKCYNSAFRKIKTGTLNTILQDAVNSNPPPVSGRHRIKLRYAHLIDHNPPKIMIYGNQTEKLPASYKRYLHNYFLDKLKLFSTPVELVFKTSDNPFADKKNALTESQKKQRSRLIKFRKTKQKKIKNKK